MLAKTRKRANKKKKGYSIEVIGIILIFISVLAIGEFGFVGRFFANIIRLFVGETYPIFSVFGILLGIYYIFFGKAPTFRTNRLVGTVMLYSSILIFLHLKLFEPIMEAEINILSATWRRFLDLFNENIANPSLGGGMIGASFYSITYFLFSNIGTYFFIGIIVFTAVMSIGDFSYQTLFTAIKNGLSKVFTLIKSGFTKIKNMVKDNVEIDHKDQKAKATKKVKQKEVDPVEVEPPLEKVKREPTS